MCHSPPLAISEHNLSKIHPRWHPNFCSEERAIISSSSKRRAFIKLSSPQLCVFCHHVIWATEPTLSVTEQSLWGWWIKMTVGSCATEWVRKIAPRVVNFNRSDEPWWHIHTRVALFLLGWSLSGEQKATYQSRALTSRVAPSISRNLPSTFYSTKFITIILPSPYPLSLSLSLSLRSFLPRGASLHFSLQALGVAVYSTG